MSTTEMTTEEIYDVLTSTVLGKTQELRDSDLLSTTLVPYMEELRDFFYLDSDRPVHIAYANNTIRGTSSSQTYNHYVIRVYVRPEYRDDLDIFRNPEELIYKVQMLDLETGTLVDYESAKMFARNQKRYVLGIYEVIDRYLVEIKRKSPRYEYIEEKSLGLNKKIVANWIIGGAIDDSRIRDGYVLIRPNRTGRNKNTVPFVNYISRYPVRLDEFVVGHHTNDYAYPIVHSAIHDDNGAVSIIMPRYYVIPESVVIHVTSFSDLFIVINTNRGTRYFTAYSLQHATHMREITNKDVVRKYTSNINITYHIDKFTLKCDGNSRITSYKTQSRMPSILFSLSASDNALSIINNRLNKRISGMYTASVSRGSSDDIRLIADNHYDYIKSSGYTTLKQNEISHRNLINYSEHLHRHGFFLNLEQRVHVPIWTYNPIYSGIPEYTGGSDPNLKVRLYPFYGTHSDVYVATANNDIGYVDFASKSNNPNQYTDDTKGVSKYLVGTSQINYHLNRDLYGKKTYLPVYVGSNLAMDEKMNEIISGMGLDPNVVRNMNIRDRITTYGGKRIDDGDVPVYHLSYHLVNNQDNPIYGHMRGYQAFLHLRTDGGEPILDRYHLPLFDTSGHIGGIHKTKRELTYIGLDNLKLKRAFVCFDISPDSKPRSNQLGPDYRETDNRLRLMNNYLYLGSMRTADNRRPVDIVKPPFYFHPNSLCDEQYDVSSHPNRIFSVNMNMIFRDGYNAPKNKKYRLSTGTSLSLYRRMMYYILEGQLRKKSNNSSEWNDIHRAWVGENVNWDIYGSNILFVNTSDLPNFIHPPGIIANVVDKLSSGGRFMNLLNNLQYSKRIERVDRSGTARLLNQPVLIDLGNVGRSYYNVTYIYGEVYYSFCPTHIMVRPDVSADGTLNLYVPLIYGLSDNLTYLVDVNQPVVFNFSLSKIMLEYNKLKAGASNRLRRIKIHISLFGIDGMNNTIIFSESSQELGILSKGNTYRYRPKIKININTANSFPVPCDVDVSLLATLDRGDGVSRLRKNMLVLSRGDLFELCENDSSIDGGVNLFEQVPDDRPNDVPRTPNGVLYVGEKIWTIDPGTNEEIDAFFNRMG